MVPPREERTNVFIGNEGECDEIFVRHLASLYDIRGKIQTRIKNAGGGDPETIVIKSFEQRGTVLAYQHSLILIDTDKPLSKAEILAQRYGFELIKSSPCIEGLFLNILGERVPAFSRGCKDLFQGKYNGGEDVLTQSACLRHFSKKSIDEARIRIINPLDILIRRLHGDFS